MRHQKAGRKFGRNTSHRRAMFRNLAGNLVLHERIVTTDEKAKELRRVVERLLSKAVRLGDDLTADLGKITDDAERASRILRVVRCNDLDCSSVTAPVDVDAKGRTGYSTVVLRLNDGTIALAYGDATEGSLEFALYR